MLIIHCQIRFYCINVHEQQIKLFAAFKLQGALLAYAFFSFILLFILYATHQ